VTPEDFQRTWDATLAKLSADERELIETVIAGAQVNFTGVYMLIAAAIGGVGGWCLARLWG
jgi:hypothetical protein